MDRFFRIVTSDAFSVAVRSGVFNGGGFTYEKTYHHIFKRNDVSDPVCGYFYRLRDGNG